MGDCCNCHSEVSRDGSGQLSRFLKALDPAYARIDDRSINDLLVFAKRYANQIRFYDIPGSEANEADKTKISWREFFRRDMAVIAASISLTDTAQLKKDYDELRIKVDAHPSHTTFDDLFDPILGMIAKIDGWYTIAIPENPLYADLQLAINSNLKSQAQQIVAYEKGFNYVDASHPLNLDYSAIKNKDVWGLNDNINADITIYQGTDTEDKIRNGALYVDDIFNSFYNSLNQLLTSSESYMQFALEKYPAHQPHMALFIAFLQLFNLAQQQMNGITQRMLDFYYHDVLHLTAKPSIPDKAHIVFELAKDVAEYHVAPGTLLKAGKDAVGKDQLYLTESDLVVNQAKVKEIKNIFIDKTSFTVNSADGNTLSPQIISNIYARPVANSKDGFGEKFTDPTNTKWPTFGKGNELDASTNLCDKILSADDANPKEQARIGLAISSPQLVLQGGKRLIEIGVNTNALPDEQKKIVSDSLTALAQSLTAIEIWFTGEKEWIRVRATTDAGASKQQAEFINKSKNGVFGDDSNLTNFYLADDKRNTLCIYLPMSEQAVIPFDAKLHTGYNFPTEYPVMLLVSDPQTALNIDEKLFKGLSIPNLTIRTKVGSVNNDETLPNFDGLKKLVLQNKDGLIDSGKPFDPFTAYPLPGRSLYIGSDEVFNKPFNTDPSVANTNIRDALSINIQRTLDNDSKLKGSLDFETYNVSVLKARNFVPIKTPDSKNGFTRNQLTENILVATELNRAPINQIAEWRAALEKGFLKLDFQESQFFVSSGGEISITNLNFLQIGQGLAPYLEIKRISLSYDSTLTLQMGIDRFFHVYPFGVVETYLRTPSNTFADKAGNININTTATDFSTLDDLKDGLLVNANNLLLPQFNFLSQYSKYYNSINSAASKVINKADILRTKNNRVGFTSSKSSNAVSLIQNAKDDAGNDYNQYIGDTQQGILEIGIENLQPLQSISMLFQFAEGSAEDEDDDPPAINWSYLTNNEWRPFKAANIVADGTYGFQTTGIIKIDIPGDATTNNTITTTGLIWLRASVTENANRIPQLIDILTQAVEAQFQDNNNDQSHFDNALPANSISKLVTPVAQIGKVQQPFASFDGKHNEIGKEFYTRVSERLRHKGRAINAWDYEHLVLDRFPSIYKIKCITHTDPNCLCRNKETTSSAQKHFSLLYNSDSNFDDVSQANISSITNDLKNFSQLKATITAFDNLQDPNTASDTAIANKLIEFINADGSISPDRMILNPVENGTRGSIDVTLGDYAIATTENCCGPQVAPGHILLIPIANLKNRNAANPLQPKTSRRTLIAIQEYLKTKTSPFVHVHAKNPVYEQIIVSFKVQFYSGIEKGYYIKKLNDEIVHFLTPWAFDEKADVKFNQKIYASSIINFIEERDYVDFITDFIMGVCCNECCPPVVAVDNGGIIQGNIFDDNEKQKPLKGTIVKIKELSITQTADDNGKYQFNDIPPGDYTLIAYFSLFNIQKQSFSIPDPPGVANPVLMNDFIRGGEHAGYSQDEISKFFNSLCSCNDIEQLLQDNPNFQSHGNSNFPNGDIVAKPCTSRSILVSVPEHIIIPFEQNEDPTPCEKRKAELQAGNRNLGAILTGVGDTETIAATSPGIKKAPVKSGTSSTVKKIKAAATDQQLKPKKPK